MMQINKRLYLFSILLFTVTALIFGCGSSSQQKNGPGTTSNEGKTKTAASGSYTVTDLTGTKVTFNAKPKKILTFAMYTDQIVLGLVTSDRLVGINVLLDDPVVSNIIPIAKKVTRKIGDPSAEQVLSMKPDLIIVSDWTDAAKIQSMRDLGLKVVSVKAPETIQDA